MLQMYGQHAHLSGISPAHSLQDTSTLLGAHPITCLKWGLQSESKVASPAGAKGVE